MNPNKVKIANTNEPKNGEEWAMECELTASSQEIAGSLNSTRRMAFKGFATKEVIDAMLSIMKEMVE